MSGPDKTPLGTYGARLDAGELRPDPDQLALVERFERLAKELEFYPELSGHGRRLTAKSWRIFSLFTGADKERMPRGLYIVGGVGRGKSMLMDLFFETAPVTSKRRVHFHQFMLDVHARLKEWRGLDAKERLRRGGRASDDDPIPPTAQAIASEATLLCFDEMQVTDIADAMVLSRLFKDLFDLGVVVVTTSNRMPDELYKGGLNRQLFMPFIELLKEKLDVFSLDGPVDYRLERLKGVETYYHPADDKATEALTDAFFRLTDRDVEDRSTVGSTTLTVGTREIFVPKAAYGVAVFSFKRLCANPLGAADYLAIAETFHGVIMVGIPQLGPEKRNEAKRFVTFIDALYEQGVKFLCSAAVAPEDLYPAGDGSFEFERTVSRLMEMQSLDYLKRGHGQDADVS